MTGFDGRMYMGIGSFSSGVLVRFGVCDVRVRRLNSDFMW